MIPTIPFVLALACALIAPAGAGATTATATPPSSAPLAAAGSDPRRPSGHLAAYRDDGELTRALARWRERAELEQRTRLRAAPGGAIGTMQAPMAVPAAPSAEAARASSAPASDSITNVQVAGVDEGGIVKRAGDHLVILRRGRLFTVRVGGDALSPVAAVDAYAGDVDPRGTWYDELLVSGRDVVVIGYSYARGGTEIGLFELRDDGTLAYRSTHHLRSFDYFSGRNYASRLIGRTLVFYTPTILAPWGRPYAETVPGLRRWSGSGTPAHFEPILPATRVFRTDDEFDAQQPLALHTVTTCTLGDTAAMRCEASAVLGPAGRVFHVSREAVYVWAGGESRGPWGRPTARSTALASVFRLPLDGGAPSALKAVGMPIDTLSFLEDEGGYLNVLLRATGPGDAMGGSERGAGAMALLRVPVSEFGDGRGAAREAHYRTVPGVGGPVQNRWIGPWLVWGGVARGPEAPPAWALRADEGGSAPVALSVGHGVERIEALGPHALLVGRAADGLRFTGVALERGGARLAGSQRMAAARQAESRTHGFFFRADDRDGNGVLGLPVIAGDDTGPLAADGSRRPRASVTYLRAQGLAFTPLGELASRASGRDDGCRASCVDWYGNARPIFLGDRVFALMGYELVEGRLEGGGVGRDAQLETIGERRRIDFSPRAALAGGRYSPF
jgi:hypothetical protein